MRTWSRNEKIALFSSIVGFIIMIATLILVHEGKERNIMGKMEENRVIKESPEVSRKETVYVFINNESKSTTNPKDHSRLSLDLPSDFNILIFSACDNKSAHAQFAEKLRAFCPSSSIDTSYDWAYRWEMRWTRLYYLNKAAKEIAQELAAYFPGKQEIIDYNSQLYGDPLYFPDKPHGRSSRMVKINSDRDLVIFVGNDYEKVLSSL